MIGHRQCKGSLVAASTRDCKAERPMLRRAPALVLASVARWTSCRTQ